MGTGVQRRTGVRRLKPSTPEERRAAVEAYRKSGLSQAMISKQWGIHPITFSGW